MALFQTSDAKAIAHAIKANGAYNGVWQQTRRGIPVTVAAKGTPDAYLIDYRFCRGAYVFSGSSHKSEPIHGILRRIEESCSLQIEVAVKQAKDDGFTATKVKGKRKALADDEPVVIPDDVEADPVAQAEVAEIEPAPPPRSPRPAAEPATIQAATVSANQIMHVIHEAKPNFMKLGNGWMAKLDALEIHADSIRYALEHGGDPPAPVNTKPKREPGAKASRRTAAKREAAADDGRTVFGFRGTRVLQWLGQKGFKPEDAVEALRAFGCAPYSERTIRWELIKGRHPDRDDVEYPPLTVAQAAELMKFKGIHIRRAMARLEGTQKTAVGGI